MIARIDDNGAGFLSALILNDSISWARIRARLGLRCYATRQRQGAGYQRDERATRRVIQLIAHDLSLTLSVRRHPLPTHAVSNGQAAAKNKGTNTWSLDSLPSLW